MRSTPGRPWRLVWLAKAEWFRQHVFGQFLASFGESHVSSQSVVGSGSWQRVNAQTAVRSPRYAVFDLAEGKPYVFRVLSANKHGLSEPSEITAPIQAQDMIGEYGHVHERPQLGTGPESLTSEAIMLC